MNITRLPEGLERRTEDYQLITGHGHYVDDLRPPVGRPSMLYMVAVRSPHAHAKINAINLEEAAILPGVVAAHSAAELVQSLPPLASATVPGGQQPERKALAVDKVRYVGDPVAVVLAENRYIAEDARYLVDVDYDPLPAVSDPEAALDATAPLLYEDAGTNLAFRHPIKGGDIQAAFAQAERTIRLRVVNQRIAASPLEPRACMFDYNPASGDLTAWLSSQSLFRARDTLATFLGLDASHINVYNADVGGGFGTKTTFLGEEIIAASLAVKYGRPVKWIEDRSENLQAQTHGRGQINYIEAAVQNNGLLLGLKVRTIADLGAFLAGSTAMAPTFHSLMLTGPYRIQAIDCEIIAAFTNAVPTAAYRGAGRPEAAYILERTIDRIAHELHLDPAEVRRRNFLSPDVFPYRTPTNVLYDSGNYQAALDRALELIDYTGWRMKQRKRREEGDPSLLGVGISAFIEISGGGSAPNAPQEAATVRIRRDGTILVQSAVAHNGQGHFTAFAQIAATVFQMPGRWVEVQMNSAHLPGYSVGTFGSRITQTSGSAILLAAEAAREKALKVAARVLEASPADLELAKGSINVRGVPARTITLGELAWMVERQPELIEREPPNPVNDVPIEGLAAWRAFAPQGASFSSGTHIAVVEIDSATGEVHILRYVAVDDCGRVLNHYLTEAQVHGGLAQGIGQALYEGIEYDQSGQNLSSTLMDYALPVATQLPLFITDQVETPSPFNPLGAKGVGEAGCIAAPPAIVNAALDALSPLGIKAIDMPLHAAKVCALIRAAQEGTLQQGDPVLPPVFAVSD
ncbi:MAG: xanthine dehydrogenase family protein molybdopterin-binding subunit [Ktedonobacteraceae bacterium]|nr:xanthine dehydrogenase family protein molybdopterin-binding subunit [Ktedonobacteraceae bacterium]